MGAVMRFSHGLGGGALLRQTPVAEARRRLAHTKPCTPEEIRDVAARVAQIDKAKEDTYDVPHTMSCKSMLMMEHLSSQLKPRPQAPICILFDFIIRFSRRHERRNTYYKFLGGVALLAHQHLPSPRKSADWGAKLLVESISSTAYS
ncbi:hypothetical protein VPH35_005476 [Triticum aestivum]